MLAAHINQSRCVQELLEWGADVNSQDCIGITPLYFAVNSNSYECTKLLLEAGAHVEAHIKGDGVLRSPLGCLLRFAAPPIEGVLNVLIENGVDVNLPTFDGIPCLIWAAAYHNTKVVRMLLHAGADINILDPRGVSALHWAIMASKSTNVAILLQSGARYDDESTIKRNGFGILHFTALFGSIEVMEALRIFALGAVDAGAKDQQGLTPWEVSRFIRNGFTLAYREPADVAVSFQGAPT